LKVFDVSDNRMGNVAPLSTKQHRGDAFEVFAEVKGWR
jgi:hypothetical protein